MMECVKGNQTILRCFVMETQSLLARTVRNDRQLQQLLKGGNWGDSVDEVIHDEKSQELAAMCKRIADLVNATKVQPVSFKRKNEWIPEQQQPTVELFAPNPNGVKTVMVRNLPRDVVLSDLYRAFTIYGTIQDIYLPKNMDKSSPYYGTIRGFALIKYITPLEAARAVAMGPLSLDKNIITLEFAKADQAPLKTEHDLSQE